MEYLFVNNKTALLYRTFAGFSFIREMLWAKWQQVLLTLVENTFLQRQI